MNKSHSTDARHRPVFALLLLAALWCGSIQVAGTAIDQTSPIEILRVSPTAIRPGAPIEITLAVYNERDYVNRMNLKQVRVAFGGFVTAVDSVSRNRAGYALTTRVPAELGPTEITHIVVLVGDTRSNRFTDFQVQVGALEIADIDPGSSSIGEPIVIQVSRDLTEEERLSAYVMFQREQVRPTEISGRQVTIPVPEVDTPTPAITLTAGGLTTKPYLDFIVDGLEEPVAANSQNSIPDPKLSVALVGGIAFLVAVTLVAVVARLYRQRREQQLQSQIAKYKFELETGASVDAVTDEKGAYEVPYPPSELIAACASGSCVLFAGSGLGSQAGYPTWRDALSGIVMEANAKAIFPSDTDWGAVLRLLRSNDVNTAARIISNNLSKEFIFEVLTGIYDKSGRTNGEMCKTVQRIPFSAIIRTSLDPVAETAYLSEQPILCTPDSPTSLFELNEIDRTSLVIYKLAGTLRDPESPKLTAGEFREALRHNQPLTRFLQGKFAAQPFLFLGTSLDSIEQFLSSCDISGGGNSVHFALVPRDEDSHTKTAMLSHYGIRFLVYDPSPGFPEFSQFVSALAEQVEKSDIVPAAKEPPSILLSKVTMDNVGPFLHLELPLTPGWNVLLGNNGCGKTTILKAISGALCGDKEPSKAAIAKLLRHDKDEGQIVLEIGNRSYTTTIRREGRHVAVRSRQVTPLEAGGMLVLGFPALRGASAGSTRAPGVDSDPPPSVDVRDVLPIVSGEIDSRMDSLTQWIIDTESRGRDDPQYERLLRKFFELMDDLTPGVTLRFGKIDKSSWKVLVDTDDGRIPIELLSQGMTSIFSWAGYLMQRLQEVFSGSPDITQESALVLVDEIDAHMHPKWQQLIVRSLKKAFPNVQFIATTHSPLITLGLDPEEIIIARRHQDESDPIQSVRVERASIDTSGFHANQLLTSPLFNLDTSGDPILYEATLRYTELSSMDERNAEEDAELADLAARIDVRLPSTAEREEARIAWTAIQNAFESQIKELPDKKRRLVTQEAKVRLQENVTGSRRP